MVDVKITYEGKNDLKSIQNKFKSQLSAKEIAKVTSSALNITANRTNGHLSKQISGRYNVKRKYLGKVAVLTKKATPIQSGLYSEVSFKYKNIPIIAFNPVDASPAGVNVKIKSEEKNIPFAFISKMKSGYIGVFARGKYVGKNFVPGGKKISQLNTASPFVMANDKDIIKETIVWVKQGLPSRLEAMLTNKLKKMSK